MTRISFKGSRLFPRFVASVAAALTFLVIGITANAQQPAAAPAGTRYDITNYRIEAQLLPEQHMLRAGADITLLPLEATRSLVFELNGSLKVESVETGGKVLSGVVQDAVGVGTLGPNVRVDLGQVMPAGQLDVVHPAILGPETGLRQRDFRAGTGRCPPSPGSSAEIPRPPGNGWAGPRPG